MLKIILIRNIIIAVAEAWPNLNKINASRNTRRPIKSVLLIGSTSSHDKWQFDHIEITYTEHDNRYH